LHGKPTTGGLRVRRIVSKSVPQGKSFLVVCSWR
jgi:hypothetical protein